MWRCLSGGCEGVEGGDGTLGFWSRGGDGVVWRWWWNLCVVGWDVCGLMWFGDVRVELDMSGGW